MNSGVLCLGGNLDVGQEVSLHNSGKTEGDSPWGVDHLQ